VKVGGQEINGKSLARIQEMIDSQPGLSRVKLSRHICEQLKWQSPNGRLKEVSCRVALLKLQRRGAIRLPEVAPFPARCKRREKIAEGETEPEAAEPLKEFQPVELIGIKSAETTESGLWNDLMNRYHYLGAGPLCGSQIRYLVRSQKQGWLGGLAFSAAAWRVEARDAWIGWDPEAREQNLNQVVDNSRFLILPQRRVPHLASHVLGLALRRLRGDWRQRYGYEPLLVETFIEAARFAGTCYRASNFVEVGKTQGRGRQDGHNQRRLPIKRVLMYAWSQQARQHLCRVEAPRRRPAAVGTAKDWAEGEFGRARLRDQRLRKRLLTMARDLYARPQAQIPEACQSRAKTKAAYRFFDHAETGMEILLESHYQATRQRLSQEKIVLAVQDTTSLNYTAHPATDDLGPLSTRVDGSMGLWLHNTMAFSVEGTPLGLLDVQYWARDAREFGKHHQRKQRPIEQKESYKWLKSFQQVAAAQRSSPDTLLVSVGDREADIYDLFALALEDRRGPKLLVRAEYDRLLADDQGHLWPRVARQPVAATQDLQVPRRGAQSARVAHLEIRFAALQLKPPQRKADLPSLKLWAVLAQEVDAPPGMKPLRWMLLTTCEVTSAASAIEKINWYRLRWGIEVYHRTLKSGCKIEDRQLGTADRLATCLAIDLVVAWRIFHLAKLGREVPDIPCTVFFEEFEWKALHTHITKTPIPPAAPPTLQQALRMVATLGGFLGRKGDGEPGTTTLWRGLQYLDGIAAMWKYMTTQYAPHLLSAPVSREPPYG
jgi:Domain of unknown function (DUF4338)/Transposase Tn5 dimerisation domain/Transposase DNA-binding